MKASSLLLVTTSLCLMISGCAGQSSATVPLTRYGLVVSDCVIFSGPVIPMGTRFTAIIPDRGAHHVAAIGEMIKKCGADDAGQAYRYTTESVEIIDFTGVAVAALGSIPETYIAHSCTSNEGSHLFVLAAQEKRSAPIWHEYHYAGYDTEPSCIEQDRLWIERLMQFQ